MKSSHVRACIVLLFLSLLVSCTHEAEKEQTPIAAEKEQTPIAVEPVTLATLNSVGAETTVLPMDVRLTDLQGQQKVTAVVTNKSGDYIDFLLVRIALLDKDGAFIGQLVESGGPLPPNMKWKFERQVTGAVSFKILTLYMEPSPAKKLTN